jgi:hypothetical protein
MMIVRRWWMVGAAALLAACASGGAGAGGSGASGASTRLPVVRARLGEDFQLAAKQIAVIRGEPLTVRFAAVVEDSRCPVGVQCIRAGEARVEIGIQQAGMEPALDTLATAPPGPQHAAYGAYDVTLVGLAPEPRTNVQAPAYVATLRVTRR